MAARIAMFATTAAAATGITPPLRMGFYYTDLSSGQKNGALLARVDETSPLVWRRFTGNPTGIAPGVVLGHDHSAGGHWDAGGQVCACRSCSPPAISSYKI